MAKPYNKRMSFQKLTPEELRQHKGVSFTGITTVFFCHDGQGRLLMQKRSKKARDEHGRWDAGGGGLKHGESVVDSMKREVKEEYNVDPINVEFIGWFDAFRKNQDGHDTHWLAMCFAVLVDPAQVKINDTDAIDDFGWFTLDKLPSPLHSQFEYFMSLYGPRLRELMGLPQQ